MALAISTQTFEPAPAPRPSVLGVRTKAGVATAWQKGLPILRGSRVRLRELRLSDAPTLLRALATREVTRFISPPPTTVAGFERFIEWAITQRALGEYLCFAVVQNNDEAIGIIQVRKLNGGFERAEWGFAIEQSHWGTGTFIEAAGLVMAFCFRTVGVRRLEARAATQNGRGNGALRKLGASREALLTRSFLRDGHYLDQYLWAIGPEDWERSKAVWGRAPATSSAEIAERDRAGDSMPLTAFS